MLFLLIFLLLPLMEGLLRKKKSGERRSGQIEPEPPRRPGGERPEGAGHPRDLEPGRWAEGPERSGTASMEAPAPGGAERPWWEEPEPAGAPTASHDVTVPDDVWELLTGQRTAAPWELEEAEEGVTLEALEEETELSAWEEGLSRTAESRDHVVHEPPRVVSLETPLDAPAERQAAFHRRLEGAQPAVPGLRRRPDAAAALGLHGAGALRRAIMLNEVLGPPRGLDEWRGPSL